MQSRMISYMQGYVEIEIQGHEPEKLMNAALEQDLSIWNVRRTSPRSLVLFIALSSFFELRPLLRASRCKLRILRRRGFPFMLRRLESRLFFATGFVCFILSIYLLSQVIWKVEVRGNNAITDDAVIAAARHVGIHPLTWKFKLPEPQALSRALVNRLEGAAWVGVEVKGTRVLIQVVEQTRPDQPKLLTPRHLVAKFDAVVTKIFAEKGKPEVRVHSKVKRGDILISGMIGSDEHSSVVVADGEVRGLVWHEYDIVSPLAHQHKVYTGDSFKRRYAVIGNRAVQLTGYGQTEYDAFESNIERRTLVWRKWTLPLGFMVEEVKEVRKETETLDPDMAKSIGLMQARGDLLQKAGKNAIITDQNILHEKIEGGKVYMKVLFESEQNIATERNIIQGD